MQVRYQSTIEHAHWKPHVVHRSLPTTYESASPRRLSITIVMKTVLCIRVLWQLTIAYELHWCSTPFAISRPYRGPPISLWPLSSVHTPYGNVRQRTAHSAVRQYMYTVPYGNVYCKYLPVRPYSGLAVSRKWRLMLRQRIISILRTHVTRSIESVGQLGRFWIHDVGLISRGVVIDRLCQTWNE